jgi:hypothetical protein
MLNLRNQRCVDPPAAAQTRVRNPGRANVVARREQQLPPQIPVPQVQPQAQINEYHLMLGRMGLNGAAIQALKILGFDSVDSFCDITEKDIHPLSRS